MRVNNNTPNFTGLVQAKPKAFENLGKDIVDSAQIATRTSGVSAAGLVLPTVGPMETTSNLGIQKFLTKQYTKIRELFNRITKRNIQPFEITDKAAAKNLAQTGATLSGGSGLVTTGLGSDAMAVGSAMDQTVHYPVLGSDMIPREFVHAYSNNGLENSAYHFLYNERGVGNESASSYMSTASGMGFVTKLYGSSLVKNPKDAVKILSENSTKLPS